MTEAARPRKPRGKPFAMGNPGKPAGARNRATLAMETLLDGEGEKLARKAVDMALAGDPVALRLCVERLAPVKRERSISFPMPQLGGAADHPAALASIFAGVAKGEITPSEAQSLAAILEHHRKAIETADIDARLRALEERTA